MDKTNRTPQGGEQLTKINSSALKPYLKAGFTPIPLHTWDSKSKIGGKVRSDGKRPRDKDWTTRPYDPKPNCTPAPPIKSGWLATRCI